MMLAKKVTFIRLGVFAVLLFIFGMMPAAAQTNLPQPYMNITDPAALVAAYYNAITLRDYNRAYGYWESPPRGQTLEQFAAGFADTTTAAAVVKLPYFVGAAAGSTYASLPVLVIAGTTEGAVRYFIGCFVARISSIGTGDAAPPTNWRFYQGSLRAANSPSLSLLDTACEQNLGLPDAFYEYTITPPDLASGYYNAITLRDFNRAYGYWESPPRGQTLQQFASGFAQTASVDRLYVYTGGMMTGAGAGNVYANLPLLITSTLTNGTGQVFAGCYTAHRTNIPVGTAAEPDPRWFWSSARVQIATSLANGLQQVQSVCPAG